MEEKGISEEIKEFLEYIGKNHKNPKKKSWENLEKRFGKQFYERVYDLCFSSGYIQNFPHGKGETRYYEIILAPKGLSFLEEQKRRKLQQNQIDAQNFLTLGILAFAIFSGFITMIYYYFDLKTKGYEFEANSILAFGLILAIIIILGIIRLKPKDSI